MSINILFTLAHPFDVQNGVGKATDGLTKHLQKEGFQVYFLHFREYMAADPYSDSVYFFPEENPSSKTNIDFYHSFLKEKNIRLVINQGGEWMQSSAVFLNTGIHPVIKLSCYHTRPLRNVDSFAAFFPKQKLTLVTGMIKCAKMILYPYLRWRELDRLKKIFIFLQQNSDYIVLLSVKFFPQLKRWHEIDLNRFKAFPNPNSFGEIPFIPSVTKKKQLLYVGRFMYEAKNTLSLIAIWKKLYKQFPDWELILCGDGAQKSAVESEIKSLPNIRMVGFQDPAPYYQTASIFCLTSTYEAWGMVLTESMQYSMIPVAFNSFESATDMIEDGVNGFLIQPFSINKYARRLSYLMNLSNEERDKIANNAYQSVKKYDIEPVIRQWIEFIHQIAK